MNNLDYKYREIPLENIERDPDQPRKDFGTEGDTNRLLVSIQKRGLRKPIDVSEISPNRFIIIDGHRRYICSQKLGLKRIKCQVYPKLEKGELEIIRYELQNNRRAWRPLERSEALQRIKDSGGFSTIKELAKNLSLSETVVNMSLQLRRQKLTYLELMEKYGLLESYRSEFIRLKPKIRKIKDFEVDDIVENIFERVNHKAIKNAKDFRKLGRIFLRATANEEQLYQYLSNRDMTVEELRKKTTDTGFSLLIEQMIQSITEKKQKGVSFSSEEKEFIIQLKDLLNKIF